MPGAEADHIYRDRDAIIAELAGALEARLPDIRLTPDAIWRIWIEVIAVPLEGLFLANQLLHNDMFAQTANALALLRYGEMYGREIKGGVAAAGTIRVAGSGGALIPVGMQVGAPTAGDETLLFNVTAPATIPNPGEPIGPVIAQGTTGTGVVAGTYEYAVTFVTLQGETAIGDSSNSLVLPVDSLVTITQLPTGGPGTIARKIYRSKDGDAFRYVGTVNDNSTLNYTDSLFGAFVTTPPTSSTAEAILVPAEADEAWQ
jgi:hypothetical protein